MDEANARKRRRQQRLLYVLGVALATAVLCLCGSVFLLQKQVQKAGDEIQQQLELNVRLRQLQAILVQLANAETGQRGFLLTGDPSYLQPYEEAVAQIPAQMEALDGLEEIEPGLGLKASRLREVIGTKLAELARTIELYRTGMQRDAIVLVQTGEGKAAMNAAREEIAEISHAVRADRDQISREIASTGKQRQSLVMAATAALALVVTLAALQISLLLKSRTRFEQDLLASEIRHRKIVEDQSELISLARPDGTLTYVNPAYARQFDTTAAALTGQNLFDHIEPAHRGHVRSLIDKVLASGAPAYGENQMQLPDGQQIWVAWTNSVQASADGTKQLHSVGRDITRQKEAEVALRESEEFLRRTGRLAGVGGWEVDLASGNVQWSEQVRELHEVDDDFVPTMESGLAFFDTSAREEIAQALRAAQRDGTPFDLEVPMTTAKGRQRCLRIVGDAQRDEGGQPMRLIGALQDITERKELENKLRESERFIREITDNLPVAIAYVDLQGRYQFVNKVHVRRFGRPREDILGKTRQELTDTPLDGARDKVSAVLRGEPQRFVVEEQIGSEARILDAQMVPARDQHGTINGFYATGVDITDLKKTEARLRELTEIIESTPDFVVRTDWSGHIHYVNPAARAALGLDDATHTNVHGRSFTEFNTPQTNERFATEIAPAIKRDGLWLGETTVLGAGGVVVPVNHLVIGHRDAQGRIARYSAIMRDISAETKARAELKLQTTTLNTVIESIPALVAVFDRQLRYRLVNKEFERQRRVRREDIIGRDIKEIFGQAEFDERWPWVQRVLSGETITRERIARHAGNARNVSVTYIPLRLDDGTVDGYITVAQDITSHREEERRLLDLSERDALTGLLNRAGFTRYVERRLSSPESPSIALLYIDLDRFKPVNDSYGHAAGDSVLQQFAQRLQNLVRPTDGVARLGGDEFALVLPGIPDETSAQMIAQKVVDAAGQPFEIEAASPISVSIGASVGVAFTAGGDADVKCLLARADERVYAAKAGGRGRVA